MVCYSLIPKGNRTVENKKNKKPIRAQKRRRRKLKKLLRLCVFVILIGIALFSFIKLAGILTSYLKNRQAYADIRDSAVLETPVPAEDTPLPVEPEETPALSPTPEPLPFYPDWEQLRTVCPDIIGWLFLDGTNIHYPVVQCGDNEYYLDHNVRKEENSGGALFLDTYCGADCRNLIVYGHRMKDDSMFGQLPEYAEKAYLQAHPVMYYLTPEQNYRVEIFACRTVKAESKYFTAYFADDGAYRQYLEKAVEQSYWAAPVEIDTQYKTLTLATCSVYRGLKDPRILVHGRLVPMH